MRRFFTWTIFAVLPLLALFYSSVPLAVYWAWDDFLDKNSLDGELGYIQWRPRLGLVRINNIRVENSAGRGFHIDQALLDIQLLPLFDKQLVVETLELIDAHLDARLFDGGFEVAGLTMLATEPVATAEVDSADSASINGWTLDLQQLHLHLQKQYLLLNLLINFLQRLHQLLVLQ